jgi:hypothetical protein
VWRVAEIIQDAGPAPRRGPADRRQRPTRMLSRYTVVGRRRGHRRASDPQSSYYIDWIGGPYLWALVAVLALIVIDTVSTLHIISRGGGEANPIMRWMLDLSPLWFALVKIGTALLAFLLLAVHRYFPVARVLTGLLLTAYGCLVIYHAYLLFRIHG